MEDEARREQDDVEAHRRVPGGTEEPGDDARREDDDEPDVEAHRSEIGRTEIGRTEIGRTEL